METYKLNKQIYDVHFKLNSLQLESPQARTAFVNSGVLLAEQHGFDGIDLAWQFARIKPKKIRSTWGKLITNLITYFYKNENLQVITIKNI